MTVIFQKRGSGCLLNKGSSIPSVVREHSGMALLLVLGVLVLLTVVVVALLTLATTERSSSHMALQRTQAELFADAAVDAAMGTIGNAISQGSQPGKSWASEPGRIWIFDIAPGTGAITRSSVDLISALPKADPDNVDLNAPSLNGEFPIAPPAPGETVATMKVGWVNILQDPSGAASKDNPLIGRVAYWVDDESCKVNINTADGSQRMNATPTPATLAAMTSSQKFSFGFGTPSEISLAALPGLDQTKAAAIAAYPWQQEFASAEEITRAKDGTGIQAVTPAMFKALRFDITHYNSSPDLNFMGEPRIQLSPQSLTATGATAGTSRQNTMLGAYVKTETQPGKIKPKSLPLDHIYPQPGQIPPPVYLPSNKLFLYTSERDLWWGQKLSQTGPNIDNDFYVGSVITNYLMGINLHPAGSNTFSWPKFDGASSAAFSGKYTLRQLDSITLQILDTAGRAPLSDQYTDIASKVSYNSGWSMASIMEKGWLSQEVVMGIGRTPKINEIYIRATATLGDPLGYGAKIGNPNYAYPSLQFSLATEYYFPSGYRGVPLNPPYNSDARMWKWYPTQNSNFADVSTLNFYDWPQVTKLGQNTPAIGIHGPGKTGTFWGDILLTALDQSGQPAGIDFVGIPNNWNDPDQVKAALYHPYSMKFSGSAPGPYTATGTYGGGSPSFTNPNLAGTRGALRVRSNICADPGGNQFYRAPGTYFCNPTDYPADLHPGKPGVTSIHLIGGLLFATADGVLSYRHAMVTPLGALVPELTGKAAPLPATMSPPVIEEVKSASIPVDLTVPVPGLQSLLLSVADPLVNQFPMDWQPTSNPGTFTMKSVTWGYSYLRGGNTAFDPYFPGDPAITFSPPANFDGDNPGFKPAGGGDPLSIWLPPQDRRLPKQARFPSVGALFSVRTGVFPDKKIAGLPAAQQKGVPFRSLNMAPSTQASQATDGGTSYPDWAMLDLFTVPFLPQKPFLDGEPVQPFRRLTYGGATIGRLNINNPEVPYPFSEAIAGVTQTPPKRNALKALFQGLTPSRSYANDEPVYTTIDATGSATLAEAISNYQKTNGPFFMGGQVANVPAIASYLYTGVDPTAISRNDVVRDIVGAITTRSNVYSVWVVAQTVKKRPTNTVYDAFQNGDTVTSEIRRHYLVERFIETGNDGVPGNAVTPSVPGTPNAYSLPKPNGDDTEASFNPALTYPLPYRWRVIAMETIQF